MLTDLSSPQVQYYDSFVDQGCLHIIMEYCENRDLNEKLKVSFREIDTLRLSF